MTGAWSLVLLLISGSMADEIVKAKVGLDLKSGASGELALGHGFGGFLERFLPWARRSAADHRLGEIILEKIERGEALSRADADFAEAQFGEAAGTYVRRLQIAGRASNLLQASSAPQLPAHQPEVTAQAPAVTADEWIRRFWEDAGALSDETLQEVYARILAKEARVAGSCSMRTLRVLRYMDHATAAMFNSVLPFVLSGTCLPRGLSEVPIGTGLELDDAGLLDSGNTLLWRFDDDPGGAIVLGRRLIRIHAPESSWGDRGALPAYPLSRAGRELAAIADVHRTSEQFDSIVAWVHRESAFNVRLTTADAPCDGWKGIPEITEWRELPRPAAEGPEVAPVVE